MKIGVFGLGYVGTVTAACLANDGHEVIGVDVRKEKVDLINAGKPTVIEADLGGLIASAVHAGRLRASVDAGEVVPKTALSLICVGTPSQLNGNLDISQLQRCCQDIGGSLRNSTGFHVIVVRSTVLPHTIKGLVIPTIEEASAKKAGEQFGVCANPEFLREGSAVKDFYSPPKTVIGATDARSADVLEKLYGHLDAPFFQTDIEVAEMIKYADNAWHALKIGFANEIGKLCKSLGMDSHRVMDIFCQDEKLNISPNYLRPGFAFGGSCLPKDLRALTYRGRLLDLDLPIMNSILPSNNLQIEHAIRLIKDMGSKKVGVLGFSFKAGTDDLRESPMVSVIEHLLGKGYDIRLYDRNVQLASLMGANRDYILNHIPHISRLIVKTIDDVLNHGEVIVIGTRDPDFESVPRQLDSHQVLVDLVRIDGNSLREGRYEGICW